MIDAEHRRADGTESPADAAPSLWQQGRTYLLGILLLLLILLALGTLSESFGRPRFIRGETDDLFLVLAPFLAIAVAIERFWEILFNWYESVALATARFFGVSSQTTRWMRQEVRSAEDAVATLARAFSDTDPRDPDYARLSTAFHVAEARLVEAQTRIEETLKTPEYVAIKRAITLLGSLIIGLVVSSAGKLTLLNSAGFPAPIPVDVLLTGLLIGSGPGPLHHLIGTLQEVRNAVAGLADLAQGSAIKKVREPAVAIETAFLDRAVSFAVAGPPGQPAVIDERTAARGEEGEGAEHVDVERRWTGSSGPVFSPQQLAAADALRGQRQARRALRFR